MFWLIAENPLAFGAVAGVINGLIVFFIVLFIAKLLLRRKDSARRLELIEIANGEIIRTLKPYIAEQGLPDKEIIDAIILSTARKHKISCEELYSVRIICEELVREIVENVYVSSSRKQEYVAHLRNYLVDLDSTRDKSLLVTEIERERTSAENADKVHYKQRLATVVSVMTSIFTCVMTAFVFFVSGTVLADSIYLGGASINTASAIIALVPLAAIVISVFLMIVESCRIRERRVVAECAE